jgi:O-antigen ligase
MAISGSRTVLVAGVVSSLLAILLGSTGRRVRLSRLLPFALAVGLTAFLFTSVVANPDRQFLPRADLLSLYTFRLRVSNWEDALTLAQTSGFFGPGLSYRHPFWRQSFHNDFLQAWILFGIPGLIGMLWICAVGLGLAFRRLLLASWQDQRVLAAGLVGSLLAGWVVSMMHLPFFEVSAYYFWFVMGLIFCPAFAESKRSTPRWASEADSRASRR